MLDPEKPEAEAFDWEAPDAFEKWAESKAEILRIAAKMPREQLDQWNATANFQADRATAWFLKAVAGMRTMRELAQLAISLLPEAQRRGEIAGRLAAAEADARVLEAQAARQRQQAPLFKGPEKAGKRSAAARKERREAVEVAMSKLYIAFPASQAWPDKAIGEALWDGQARFFTFKGEYIIPGKSPFKNLRGVISAVSELRRGRKK